MTVKPLTYECLCCGSPRQVDPSNPPFLSVTGRKARTAPRSHPGKVIKRRRKRNRLIRNLYGSFDWSVQQLAYYFDLSDRQMNTILNTNK